MDNQDFQLIQEENLPSEYVTTDKRVIAQAKTHIVKDQDTYDIAVAFGKAFAGIVKERKDYFKPRKDAAKKVHQMWVDAEKESVKPIEEARAILSRKVLKYEQEQEEIRRAEEERQRKIAAERERKEREEYERRQAELRKQAEEEGEPQEDLFQEEFTPTVTADDVVVQPTFVKGGQTRQTWTAEVTDFKALVKWVVESDNYDMLLPNTSKLSQLAKAYKKESYIDGVKFYAKATKIL